MSSSPYMKFWVGDYLSSARVMSLTPLGELAYFRLILWCWQSEGGLPNNDTSLASLCRLSGKQWATIRVGLPIANITGGNMGTDEGYASIYPYTTGIYENRKYGGREKSCSSENKNPGKQGKCFPDRREVVHR